MKKEPLGDNPMFDDFDDKFNEDPKLKKAVQVQINTLESVMTQVPADFVYKPGPKSSKKKQLNKAKTEINRETENKETKEAESVEPKKSETENKETDVDIVEIEPESEPKKSETENKETKEAKSVEPKKSDTENKETKEPESVELKKSDTENKETKEPESVEPKKSETENQKQKNLDLLYMNLQELLENSDVTDSVDKINRLTMLIETFKGNKTTKEDERKEPKEKDKPEVSGEQKVEEPKGPKIQEDDETDDVKDSNQNEQKPEVSGEQKVEEPKEPNTKEGDKTELKLDNKNIRKLLEQCPKVDGDVKDFKDLEIGHETAEVDTSNNTETTKSGLKKVNFNLEKNEKIFYEYEENLDSSETSERNEPNDLVVEIYTEKDIDFPDNQLPTFPTFGSPVNYCDNDPEMIPCSQNFSPKYKHCLFFEDMVEEQGNSKGDVYEKIGEEKEGEENAGEENYGEEDDDDEEDDDGIRKIESADYWCYG